MKPVRTYKNGNKLLRIYQDPDPMEPRNDWDHAATMVCFHHNYDLGDKHDFKSPSDLEAHIEKTGSVSLPVYLMDHSGLRVSTGSFGCPWDSGQVGMIFITPETLKSEFNGNIEHALTCMKSEVEQLDTYLKGDIYGFELVEISICDHGCPHDKDIDSCWGFYGFDPESMFEHAGENLNEWSEA